MKFGNAPFRIAVLLYSVSAILAAHGAPVERAVGPGVTHIADFQETGPLNFNVLKVNLPDQRVTVEVEPGQDRLFAGETVETTAERESRPGHAVIGGVNADFWNSDRRPYVPVGVLVANGMVGRRPDEWRSVFGITSEETVFFEPITMKIALVSGKKRLEVERLNEEGSGDGVALHTSALHPDQVRNAPVRVVLELPAPEFLPNKPTRVRVVRHAKAGEEIPLTSQTLLLTGPSARLSTFPLKPGAELRLEALVPEVKGVITFCCGAAPRILRDGQVSIEYEKEKVGRSFSTARHPRTAVGVADQGKTLYLVTVDGRQPTISRGATLEELAQYMSSLGCTDAVNLDGGGSTTMVVRGEVVNRPSDAIGPRRVVNSILVVGTGPTGPLAQLEIEPAGKPLALPAGTSVRLIATGFDSSFNPVPVAGSSITWSAERVGAIVPDQGGGAVLKTSATAASGEVVARSGSVQTRVPVQVHPIDELVVDPAVLLLSSDETVLLKVQARAAGRDIPLQPEMVRTSASSAAASAAGLTVRGQSPGRGELTLSLGSASARVPYFVEQAEAQLLEGFDDSATLGQPSGTNYNAENTRSEGVAQGCPQGQGCLRLHYAMNKGGGRSEITLPIGKAVEQAPAKIGLWVYGDGKEAWVRGELVDAAGTRFLIDFTEGAKGVLWKNEWRRITVPWSSLVARGAKPGTRPRLPAVLKSLSVSQDQEALKATGELRLDGLELLYPPGNSPES